MIKHLPTNQDLPSKLSLTTTVLSAHTNTLMALSQDSCSNPTLLKRNLQSIKKCVHSAGPCCIHPSKQNLLTSQTEKFKSVTDLLSTNANNPCDQAQFWPQKYPAAIPCTWMGCWENPTSFGSPAAEPFPPVPLHLCFTCDCLYHISIPCG